MRCPRSGEVVCREGGGGLGGHLIRHGAMRRATFRGPAGPTLLKNVHWTFFRALGPPGGKAPAGAAAPTMV